jgi:hypothetical protein
MLEIFFLGQFGVDCYGLRGLFEKNDQLQSMKTLEKNE